METEIAKMRATAESDLILTDGFGTKTSAWVLTKDQLVYSAGHHLCYQILCRWLNRQGGEVWDSVSILAPLTPLILEDKLPRPKTSVWKSEVVPNFFSYKRNAAQIYYLKDWNLSFFLTLLWVWLHSVRSDSIMGSSWWVWQFLEGFVVNSTCA